MASRGQSKSKRPPRGAVQPRRRGRGASDRGPGEAPSVGTAAEPGEDPVVVAIVEALASADTLSPRDIAVSIAAGRAKPGDGPDLWRRYFMAVKQRAVNLAREGRIEIVRKGRVVDPSDFKGIVRYRLARL